MNISKTLLTTSCACLVGASANATNFKELKPYVGIDYQHSIYDYNSNYVLSGLSLDGNILLEDGLNGVNIHAGVRPHKNIGVELGYFHSSSGDRNITNGQTVGNGTIATADFSTEVETKGITLDALGYIPIGANENFELIGTTGIS